jgi:quinolinate synthase
LRPSVIAPGEDKEAALAVVGSPLQLEEEVQRLKKELNAVILAHYYQESEIQDVADFVGDSLALAQEAAKTDADTIVFCGVHFMAETAKILNPEKLVLLPDLKAGCSLSDRCPPPAFRAFVDKHPGAFVVTYVNSSAAVKAMSDVICTSSNAARIVAQAPKDMVLWPGSCMVHEIFSEKRLVQLKTQNPGAVVVAHPECEAAVLRHADYVGSTRGILEHVLKSPAHTFIVATEVGILHQMQKHAPQKRYIAAPPDNGCACNECPHMKLNTLEKLARCMRTRSPALTMPPELMQAARAPLERMLAWS